MNYAKCVLYYIILVWKTENNVTKKNRKERPHKWEKSSPIHHFRKEKKNKKMVSETQKWQLICLDN